MNETFRSLRIYNYRLWAIGAIVSNVGTWMQRTAQDWLVLTQLTQHSATSVGIVLALQFAPQLLLLPLTGLAADHLNRRHLVMATQASMGLLALGLGLLTVTGVVQLWQVYLFALLLGAATAFDAPARQTFVAELVDAPNLSNAVGLNSTSFNIARLIGPSIAGLLIAAVGSGWVFLINAATFAAVLTSLALLRRSEMHATARQRWTPGSFVDGFRYINHRPDLKAILLMLFLIGTFGLNFPLFLSTMTVGVFHAGAGAYGLVTSTMAIGSVIGALLAARRSHPRIALLFVGSTLFGIGLAVAAVAPTFLFFALALIVVGVASQTLTTTAISTVQLATEPAMRGRVIAILLAVTLGATPIGAPIVGGVTDAFGPRWGVSIGAAGGFAAAVVGAYYLVKYQQLRVSLDGGRLRIHLNEPDLLSIGLSDSSMKQGEPA
ncbi:Predicted arabinose efflux permease, MFS family [Frankineae bacterium MT45]|nr:Predicted arabinose efflux permease, MFS family [Frankineae bacterium MT45]